MASTYRTSPEELTRMPPGVPFIIGNEACERFSYYGMRAILQVHLTALFASTYLESAHAESAATQLVHLFFAGVYAFLGTNSADSKGSLTLDGAGTTFTLSNDLHVGIMGTGMLAITNGATFSGSQLHLGTNAGAVGTATVDGAGSSLTTYAFSTVGSAGKIVDNVLAEATRVA